MVAKIALSQTSLNSGELAPRVYMRDDTEQYFTGAKTVENFHITPFGGAERIPGTVFAWQAKYTDKRCRLLRFVYSSEDAYVMEFGEEYIRFGKGNGQLALSDASAWVTGTGYVVGDYVKSGTVIYYCIVAHTSAAAFADDLAANRWVAQSIYEVPSPYAEEDLRTIHYATTGDIGYFVEGSHPLYKLSRFGDVDWTFNEVTFLYPPFYPTNTNATHTMTPSATIGNITITSSIAYFSAVAVGSFVQITHGATVGYAEITGFTSTTIVSATVRQTFGATTASDNWNISPGTFAGGIDTLFFQDQRLFLVGKTTCWGSKTSIFEDFELGSSATDGIRFTIASNNVNDIVFADSMREVLLGTFGGMFIAKDVSDATAIPSVRKQNEYGGARIQPQKISAYLYYVTKNKKKIREAIYNFDADGYLNSDVTQLSEHILGSGVEEVAYQQEPNNMLWCVREDGEVACMIREPEQGVLGWFRVKEKETTDLYESVAVTPSTNEDRVWFSVQREIDGDVVRYIEYMAPINFTDKEECNFVRSGVIYDGVATDTITGLDHLEGREVCIFGDSAVVPSVTVDGGEAVLAREIEKGYIGLPYTSSLVLMRPGRGSENGSTQGKRKRINKVTIRFYKTISGKVAYEGVEKDTIPFRSTEDATNESVPLFTGDIEFNVRGGWSDDCCIEISQDLPLPMGILGIVSHLTVND